MLRRWFTLLALVLPLWPLGVATAQTVPANETALHLWRHALAHLRAQTYFYADSIYRANAEPGWVRNVTRAWLPRAAGSN